MQLSSRILTALAVLILAVAVVAVRTGSPGTVYAATGTIDVLNVGTCYTTNDDAFGVGDCMDGHEDDVEEPVYDVGGVKTISEVASVYATYAIDPKTSGDAPRGILTHSDLIQISIEDKGRDARSGVLFAVADTGGTGTAPPAEMLTAIYNTLRNLDLGGENVTEEADIELTDTAIVFTGQNGATGPGAIGSSGNAEFRLNGTGSNNVPMAPVDDGDVFWFGNIDGTTPIDLENYVELDEDISTGEGADLAPWMRVTASVPDDTTGTVTVQYIYYQTSEREELVGGKTKADYDGEGDNPDAAVAPDFFDAENRDTNPATLSLSANADGDTPSQNLWLKETSRFSGIYEGYVRLTDANGNGVDADGDPQDWGIATKNASGAGMVTTAGEMEYAVLGVESGPVTISYRNSNGDARSVKIQIDTLPPSVQLDSPANGVSSKDDSPDVFGSFSDSGGSALREKSFRLYADNMNDSDDDAAIWQFYVNELARDSDGAVASGARGYVCVDAVLNATDEDATTGCETNAVAGLRGHYSGYQEGETFGIIPANDIYRSTEDTIADDDTTDDFKVAFAETYDDGATMGEFDDVVRIDFPVTETDNKYNHTIDIQAVVIDRAGNLGFSDSQESDPTFIHDFGTKVGPKPTDRDPADTHNVLGWYSRHVYHLDDVDPQFDAKESATGFFTDENGAETQSTSGLMVTFDGDLAEESVGTETFAVQLDDGTDATIVDVDVDGKKVYILLEETLAPDASPEVNLATGQSVLDLAGNESTSRRLEGFELNDGIRPTFTITLSGGTGLNEDIDGQGPSELTKNRMTISIASNEDIQGAPKFAVVCSGLTWGKAEDENSVAKFAANRNKAIKRGEIGNQAPIDDDRLATNGDTTCDGDADPRPYFDVAVTSAHSRSGNNWQYEWSDLSGENQSLADGKLNVIVWGRDTGSYENAQGDLLHNFSSATATFTKDTALMEAWDDDGPNSELVPSEGQEVFEPRPFVLLAFGDEKTKVDVTTFEIDGVDVVADVQILDDNEFVWWPEPLAKGTYEVYVEANDGANNQGDYTYKFTVKERAPFVLDLLAGWNSVSFPANPVDRALHAVFTNTEIDRVVGWNVTEPVSPWRIATRQDGVWTTSDDYATLNDVEARYGYWVHSMGFINQAVLLAGKGDRATDGQPNPSDIPTDEGWNFVGVVDVDGDQTQDDAGETLRNSNNDPITAAEYLGNYTRAYTWDHVNNTWDVLKKDEGITIGTGVWVYYTKDHDIAP